MELGWNLPNVRTSFAQQSAPTVDWCNVARVTIDVLPDLALLEIFDFHTNEDENQIEVWHTLVHVCRRWRIVVFGSPSRLNLRLLYTSRTPIGKMLHVWPLLPIAIRVDHCKEWNVSNIIEALDHYSDLICQLRLVDADDIEAMFSTRLWDMVLEAMQRPFPALTSLWLLSATETNVVGPSFLGGTGSVPRLQTLRLYRITFPGLSKLLLSATHLVDLELWDVPPSGCISPEAMLTCLSVLTRLATLKIGFLSSESRSYPDRTGQRPPPLTHAVLSILTKLKFKGLCEYLEDLVAWLDVPLLDELDITFVHQLTFDTSQLIFGTLELAWFISRTPKFKAHDQARVVFDHTCRNAQVTLPQKFGGRLSLGLSHHPFNQQLSSLAQVCSLPFPPNFIVEVKHLYIIGELSTQLFRQDVIGRSEWLELLHPFTAVEFLYIPSEFVPCIASFLQEIVEDVTEVLPVLQTIYLDERLPEVRSNSVQEAIGQFVAARQVASRPIAIHPWNNLLDVLKDEYGDSYSVE